MALDTTFTVTGDHADYHGELHAHYNNWMDVKDYGAVGDGSADDTAAIQAAIDAGAVGRTKQHRIFFPGGNYRITDTLNCTDRRDITLMGESPRFTRIVAYCTGKPVFDLVGATAIQFQNIAIQGSSSATPSVAFFIARSTLYSASQISFSDCHLYGAWSLGGWYNVSAEANVWRDCVAELYNGSPEFAL